jgi:hypothetical protein
MVRVLNCLCAMGSLVLLIIARRFGFPSAEALAAGKTGTDCRGEEHDVVVVWSVTSGKRQVIMDGREVHFASTRVSVMDHSWSTRGNHIIKVVCHAAAPVTATPGFRQYDLFIDGMSFFTMPKVYELGLRGGERAPVGAGIPPSPSSQFSYAPSPVSSPPIRAPRSPDEEEADLQRAINASLEESKRHLTTGSVDSSASTPRAPAPTAPAADLLSLNTGDSSDYFASPAPVMTPGSQDFGDNQSVFSYGTSTMASSTFPYASPPPPQQQPPPPQQQQQYPSQALVVPPVGAQPSYPGAPPAGYGAPYAPAPPQYGAAPPANPYAPPAPAPQQPAYFDATQAAFGMPEEDPFAPKPPSHHEIANEILSAYGPSTTAPPAAAAWGAPPPASGYYPGQQYGAPGAYGGAPYANGDAPPMENGGSVPGGPPAPLSMNALVETEEKPENPFEAALKKLVNIDRIDEPAPEQLSLTMKKKEDENAKKLAKKSMPKPPAAARQVGSAATLAHISEVKAKSAPTTPKEGIMNAPPPSLFNPHAHMAGALVLHGAPMPPMQQHPGFGGGGFGYGAAAPVVMPAGGGYPGYPPGMYPPQAQYATGPPPQQAPPQQYPPPLQQTPYQYR